MAKRAQASDDEGSDSGSDVSLINVDFDFLSPNPDVDYQAIKRLLGQLFGRDAEKFSCHELTELILSQTNIGSTIKTDGEESDPYALLTVLNMHVHHEHPSIKAIAQYCLEKSSSSPELHSTLQSLFSQSEKHVGLVICERLINMPVQVIPPLYNMLKDEVRNAVSQGLPYKFSHLLFISRTYHLSLEEESQLENSMPASEARKKKAKTKKRKSEAGDDSHVRPEDGVYSFHPEDAAIMELSSHTLNYKYTAPLPETHQESRDKHAFGLDTRGRMMLLPLENPSAAAMDTGEDTWDVLAEKLAREYAMASASNDLKLELTGFTYGYNQRRTEIELRPVVPEAIRGNALKIRDWVDGLAITMSPDFKFTNEWGCEICGKTARESKYHVVYWTHLAQPRVVFYIHNLCEAGTNYCHRVIKEQADLINAITPTLPDPRWPNNFPQNTDYDDLPESPYPAASSCAKCHDEKTAKKGYRMSRCGGCMEVDKLTTVFPSTSPACHLSDLWRSANLISDVLSTDPLPQIHPVKDGDSVCRTDPPSWSWFLDYMACLAAVSDEGPTRGYPRTASGTLAIRYGTFESLDDPGRADEFGSGNMKEYFDGSAAGWEYRETLRKKHGRLFKFRGLFQEDILVVSDPKALYHILIKESDIFEEADDFIRMNSQLFGKGLLSTLGEQHRRQRKMLNPVFSGAHMREMSRVRLKVEKSIASLVSRGEKEIDVLSWMTRMALELVARSGFGYSFDTLEPDAPEHPYAVSLRNFAGTINDPIVTIVRMLSFPYVHNIGTPRFQRAVVDALPWKKLHGLRDMVDVMHRTSIDIFENAKRGLKDGGSHSGRFGDGKDIMSALIRANINASEQDRLPEDELIAQVSTITFAAMDTTSNGMSRILYLLSENPDVQERLRREVVDAYSSQGGDLDYDTLTALPFLDAVCRETLRLHTPVPNFPRQTKKDTVLPLGTPITTVDGREISEIPIPKDTVLFMSLHNCNRDPAIWGPDANEWKPERWLSPLPATVTEARIPGVYSNLMTFLGGSRSCIGFKFAQLEMKLVISTMIRRFKFRPSGKKVEWMDNGVVQPVVQDANPHGSHSSPNIQLPLKLSLL
ncbi:hypothetical protein NMY22_g9806 [Coprinellus aureogranulatus]|nr:hypothetical protein NMY22_g9806 [Coprinellus aureogranulatus]